jgi:hypothetical protein
VSTGIGVLLKTYLLYIHHDRSGVPKLEVITAPSDSAARDLARQRLDESPHHRLVEIWEDDRAVGRIENID